MLDVGTLCVSDSETPWLPQVAIARRLLQRMRGLLGLRGLPAGCGLLIEPCNSIHMLGMRFPLDVIFLDRQWRVVSLHRAVQPGRWMVWGGRGSYRVLEIAVGGADLSCIAPGTPIQWRAETRVASLRELG